jgi:hypothetical protein
MGAGKNYQVIRVDDNNRRRPVDTHLSASGARSKADRRRAGLEPGSSDWFAVEKQPERKRK